MVADGVLQWAAEHPREIVIWTHGAGWALALRRGRIENLFSRLIPSGSDDSEE
jgi:hypothetical protein